MADLHSIDASRLPKDIEDNFRRARAEAVEKKANAVVVIVVSDNEPLISYKVFSYGVRNSHVIGYLELAKNQIYENMSRG